MTPYQKHKEKWADCRRCGLCEGRNRVVLARGKLPCDLLIIGEAPGASEDALGVPFVGPAGRLLDRIIADALGQDAASQYPKGLNVQPIRLAWTNLVACLPRDPDGEGKLSEPPKESIEACAPRLRELTMMAKPKLIVCVGGLAEKWVPKLLVGSRSIAIVHPAAILRAPIAAQGMMIMKCVVTLATALEEL